MLVIPAIDLKEGKCVRLRQGRMDDSTVFSENPVEMAARWVDEGARRLHLVDLDGAISGKPRNAEIISEIVSRFPDLPVQVGGGIRDDDTVQVYLDAGVQWVIIGTKAVSAPHFVNDLCLEFPGRIIVGLDARNGKVAIDGWSKLSHHDVEDMAQHFEQDGVAGIIFTDISRDGMMQGVNIDSTVSLARSVHVPVFASGGVTSIEDIRRLCEVADEGIDGVIVGRALYEGGVKLSEAQALVDQYAGG
ncbi:MULTISPECIES: 1-(5-phosphoribosyl)-5-[(5-phosphoribosylamino)methylideneamino]imidazole-4-carboxamide isomerase [unclassified Ectothiorhodospira]|jgi:phosphoribosylformimino-5-aminoimidazole carboxamide ribotide isomerase|uniref:1-(5-phosphoribosyl)-5-[(5- phosphoribosylamino)methylideneamino]imidazole-4- carboxamide isomerase n=1 Tax=unclassified Ectothiorhodospira TaxID=2684909 RepID=UPI001EE927B6|nr:MULTISPECIES: 1-(5-phosphoribosyl)-5-[(5-phosphoribosylamino)methylideneamino]imidazole-4-carboxamide isomerase [unclassified Ectothiorhodospira]MCG5517037.1 1-(5-phosphoribosyl)-5-[(5-phosphoribosylamino)methylideneamino]imidazole-4-carboxamide isomerase [Ectothiorhodospira sp. 9100]MCG5519924.1 1-(5-phosphoribosyl)-5-[(5-phosphoribosylamino)methylideneamino]imidazole-4-carboxamide isomerase [Ectothiorhodospira sp. 9905]